MSHATGKPTEYLPVSIGADLSLLSARERNLLEKLVEAVKLVNPIFLEQMNQDLEESNGIFDKERVSNFYPEGVTRDEIQAYIATHPAEKEAILSPVTVVTQEGALFKAEPYSVRYREPLEKISALLEEASSFADDAPLKKFLLSKAAAFRTNEYRASDIDWVHVDGAPVELTIGPYEVYDDHFFGVKANFGAIVGVIVQEATGKAKRFQKEVGNFDAALGKKYGYSVSTTLTPMLVIDEVCGGGLSLYKSIPMAYNLPNDRTIHEEVGSKKVFLRNIIDAKFTHILEPIARRVTSKEDCAFLTSEAFMAFIVGHESAHGLSFYFDGDHFLELGSLLEEAKADIFGLLFLGFLAEQKIIPQKQALGATTTHVMDGLRQLRFGLEDAHAAGSLIQYNWLIAEGALKLTKDGLSFDRLNIVEAFQSLADAFYELSQGDYEKAATFVEKWGSVPEGLQELIERLADIPINIDPVFQV